MIKFKRQASPVGAFQDLRAALTIRHAYQWWFLLAAFVVTVGILSAFYLDSYFEKEYKREIIYVQNWRADRSIAEIRAQQKIDEPIRLKREAELKAKREKRRREFKQIDDKLKSVGI